MTIFREVQRFRQPWILIMILGMVLLAWWGFVQQIIFAQAFGTNPAPDIVVILIWLVFGLAFPVFWMVLGLITEVNENGVQIRFIPFINRTIPFDQIQTCTACTYRPIRDYGGWGIRWAGRGHIAYNVHGKQGVKLELVDGKKIMIGTQMPDELAMAIQSQKR